MKRYMFLTFLLLVAGTLVFATGAGESASAGSGTTLRFAWYGSEVRHQKNLAIVELFESRNPDITVMPEYGGADGYWDKINVQLSTGNAPDIITLGGNILDYSPKGMLLALDKYKGNLLDVSSFDEVAMSEGLGSYNGTLYGLALGTNMLSLVYNKSAMDRYGVAAPRPMMSWDEWRSYLLSIVPKLPSGVWPLTDNSGNSTAYLYYWMRGNGTPLFRNGRTQTTVPAFEKWLSLWDDYRANRLVPDAETTGAYADTSPSDSMMVAGKTLMTVLWTNTIEGYQGAMTDELEVTTLPGWDTMGGSTQIGGYIAANAASKNPDAAVRFMNFFANDVEARKILLYDRGVPCSSAVRQAIAPFVNANDKKIDQFYGIAQALTTAQDQGVPNDTEWTNGNKLICQRVAFNRITVAQGASELYNLLNRMIEGQASVDLFDLLDSLEKR